MGRHRKKVRIDDTRDEFRELDEEYAANAQQDPAVAALNSLPPDERSLMILFIACGNNKAELGRQLGASESFARYKIKEIQAKLKELTNINADL